MSQSIIDADTFNQMYREEEGYNDWVQQRRNQILKITNIQKRQAEWDRLFPKPTYPAETESIW